MRKAALAAILLVTASCGSAGPDGSSSAADVDMVPWQHKDLTFDHRTDWAWLPTDPEIQTKKFTVLGYLATVPIDVDQICTGTAKRQKCNFANYALKPGTLVVTIMTGQALSADVWQDETPGDASAMTAGGMPSVFRESSDADEHLLLSWRIARPDAAGGWYQIGAELRGPGEAAMRQQLEALIGSVVFEPPVEPLPTDRRSVNDMAYDAMKQLRADPDDGSSYDCFLDRPGARPGVVDRIPGAPRLATSLSVSCSFRAEATRWNVWRLSLRYSWAAIGDRRAGSWLVTQWVTADGMLGASSAAGDKVP
ncbi:MAG TPA: hypothetical protein VES36_08195 [Candidatus Limnocylindrales bacterium]|nr:hypothetical protein [Candidatus Limnocylindrales bacterium]